MATRSLETKNAVGAVLRAQQTLELEQEVPVAAQIRGSLPSHRLSRSPEPGGGESGEPLSQATIRYTWKHSAYSRFTLTPWIRATFHTYSGSA